MTNVRFFSFAAATVLLFGLPVTLTAQRIDPVAITLSQEQLEAIAIQPASNWGNTGNNVVPEMIPLFKEESIEFGSTTKKYRLHVPEKLEPGKKYPLILWLHGAGECGEDNKLQLVHLHHVITYLTGEKKRDFFLLVPQQSRTDCSWGSLGASSYGSVVHIPSGMKNNKEALEQYKKTLIAQTKAASADDAVIDIEQVDEDVLVVRISSSTDNHPLEYAFAMIEQVAKNYPVDRDRITVSGLSTGGDGTWRALERRPELFAAAVPLANWVPLTDAAIEKSPILKKIPIWSIYSSDDSSIDSARAEFERVAKAGCNVKKTEFGICGHSAWTPAMLQADIFAWLLSRAKKGDEYISVFDPGVNPDDLKGIVDVATRATGSPALAPAVEKQPAIAAAQAIQRLSDAQRAQMIRAQQAIAAQQQRQFQMERVTLSDGSSIAVARAISAPGGFVLNPETEKAYVAIAERYFLFSNSAPLPEIKAAALAKFLQSIAKISPEARTKLITKLVQQATSIEGLAALENMLDGTLAQPGRMVGEYGAYGGMHVFEGMPGVIEVASDTTATCISAERIIEECNRPWAMTSGSLYGMFPADWDKEAAAIPDFVVNSTSDDLAKQLARSVGEDAEAKDFVAACKSILSLSNKPMSSPWFETGGGRLRSEISYSLSAKGQMFVRFLRTVKDSSGTDKARELSKVAEKTLEKIDLVLAK